MSYVAERRSTRLHLFRHRVVLEIAGEEDVGSRRGGGVRQRSAAPAADGDPAHQPLGITGDPDTATVRLHRALYLEEAITEAAATFAGLASFAVRADGDHYVVDLSAIARDVDGDVVAEFCNFALANTARRRRSGHA